MGAMVSLAAPAQAAPVSVTVTVHRFIEVDDPDPGPAQGCCGDPVISVKIGSNPFQSTGEFTDQDDISPFATFTRSVDDGAPVLITIHVEDVDTALAAPNDVYDLNPVDNVLDINLVFDPIAGTWGGDVPPNAGFSVGDGDTEHAGIFEGGERGKILFDVSLGPDGDLDDDGIPDGVERFGVRDTDGNLVADMAALGADPCRKTVAVEVDWMGGAADGHTHRPDNAAIAEAVAAFNAAPLPAVTPCPYAGFPTQPSGVNLVVDVSNQIPEAAVLTLGPGFNAVKADPANFNPARGPYFHYNLWVHDQAMGSSSSGLCCTGKDFLVSLGSWGANQNGTVRQQSGTFIHELGHDLGLGHGGGDGVNYKPNYLSVMNYSFQTTGLTNADSGTSAIDYSRADLPDLNKAALNENSGVGDGPLLTIWTDPAFNGQSGRADGALDWDFDGALEASVAVDVNNEAVCVGAGANNTIDTVAAGDDVIAGGAVRDGANQTCNTAAAGDDSQDRAVGSLRTTVLTGFDDWANIKFRAAMSVDAGGVNILFDEITREEALRIENLVASELGTCPASAPTISGTNGNDDILGTPGPDVIHALGGNDRVFGGGGDDIICGGDGNDELYGENGNDQVYGGGGADNLVGDGRNQVGNDNLIGGLGNDQMAGGAGNDTLDGNLGVDGLAGGAGNDSLDARDGQGSDLIVGGDGGGDICRGDAGDTIQTCP